MFCFQLSLLLFKSIAFSHHLYTCRRAEESHIWQLVSSGRQSASLEGDHPPIHPNSTCIQRWLSLGLSSPFMPPYKAFSAVPQAQSQALVSRISPFSVPPVSFASRNIPVVPARLLSKGKRFRWLCSLCLCQTFTFLLTPPWCHRREHWQEAMASAPWL